MSDFVIRERVAEWDDNDPGDLFDLIARLHEPWMRQGACNGVNPKLFFPERGEPTEAALAVCNTCKVRDTCLNHALTNNVKDGVWGGTTGRQRRRLRRQMNITSGRPRRPAA